MVKAGNNDKDDDEEEEMMDVMDVLPPLVARRVKRLKCFNTERARVMEQYMEGRSALEMKYLDLCKPLYEERGNFVVGCLDDEIERIHKEGGGEKEEEGSKGDDDGDDVGEGEERVGAASLDVASDDDKIFGAISSGEGTTTTNAKAANDEDDEDGRMVGTTQFWVCAMGHMGAVSKLITERVIDCQESYRRYLSII